MSEKNKKGQFQNFVKIIILVVLFHHTITTLLQITSQRCTIFIKGSKKVWLQKIELIFEKNFLFEMWWILTKITKLNGKIQNDIFLLDLPSNILIWKKRNSVVLYPICKNIKPNQHYWKIIPLHYFF